ncbi:MAG: sugar ABC transporter permease [Clostridia bacterium]|nr:sugar ABC transporter permease [Clostridia bacterium]
MKQQETIEVEGEVGALLTKHGMPRKKKKMNEMEKKGLIFSIVVLVPVFITFLVFWVGVNFQSILLAFIARDVETGKEVFSLYNFEKIIIELKNPNSALGEAFINTMKYFALHLVKIFLSVIIAYFLYKKVPGHIFYKILFYLPAMIPSMVYITIFKEIIGVYGPIYTLLESVFGYEMPALFASDATATNTILFYVLWSGFGTSMLVYVGAMNRIPGEVIDAAYLDGCGMAREFFQIVLPLIWETFGTYFLLAFTTIFMETGPLLYFVGFDRSLNTMTINYWMFTQVYGNEYNMPSAIGLFFSVLTVPFVIVCRYLISKIETVTY